MILPVGWEICIWKESKKCLDLVPGFLVLPRADLPWRFSIRGVRPARSWPVCLLRAQSNWSMADLRFLYLIKSATSLINAEIAIPAIVEGAEDEAEDSSVGLSPLSPAAFTSQLWAAGIAAALEDLWTATSFRVDFHKAGWEPRYRSNCPAKGRSRWLPENLEAKAKARERALAFETLTWCCWLAGELNTPLLLRCLLLLTKAQSQTLWQRLPWVFPYCL